MRPVFTIKIFRIPENMNIDMRTCKNDISLENCILAKIVRIRVAILRIPS